MLEGVETDSTLGLVVVVSDCPEAAEATLYNSGTGVSSSAYEGNVDVTDNTAFTLSNSMVAAIDGNLSALGHVDAEGEPATFEASGGLINFIFDAEGAPVSGATVSCAAGYCPAYYAADAEGFDLSATETGMMGLAVLPGAPITTYSVEHAEKSFGSATMGSLAGIALFVAMTEDVEEGEADTDADADAK